MMEQRALAVMFTLTTYGTWLRGDRRGWVDNGVVYPPDPLLEAADRGRMRHEPYLFNREVRWTVGSMIGQSLIERLGGVIHAMTVGRWHVHVVVATMDVDLSVQVKCMKDSVRWGLRPGRPVWGRGYDKRFCFTPESVRARIEYVRRHNIEDGLDADPWGFIAPFPW